LSKVAIEGNALGSGTLTIAAPNTNSNFTLDIPSASGVIDRLNRAGNVLQVLQGIFNSGGAASTTSTTFVQFPNLALSITPTSASNKILVLMSTAFFGPSGQTMFITIARGATNLGGSNGFAQKNEIGWTNTTMVYLDSPNTTSSVTYNLYARVSGGTGFVYGDAGMTNTVTLLEIAG
jgi:hypothetical protein